MSGGFGGLFEGAFYNFTISKLNQNYHVETRI